MSERIPIVSKNGTTIYGRMIDVKTKKLGRYEVFSDLWGHSGPYATYAEAEKRYTELVGKTERQ